MVSATVDINNLSEPEVEAIAESSIQFKPDMSMQMAFIGNQAMMVDSNQGPQ